MAEARRIGVLGGSGLYELPGVDVIEEIELDTLFGEPSDTFKRVDVKGVEVIFLARHGGGHRTSASGVNFRANIYGFKALGVDTLLSVSAVGSMKEKYRPTDIVIPDQFFDLAKKRENSFFTGDLAIHVGMADPVCPILADILFRSGEELGARVHQGGTYICIDGPHFSTRAESNVYRGWGVDVIGMTAATEAKLCREAEMCYSPMALVTDYDVWKSVGEDVSGDIILENMRRCLGAAKDILLDAIPGIPGRQGCDCRSSLEGAIFTDPAVVSPDTRKRLEVLIGRYLPPEP